MVTVFFSPRMLFRPPQVKKEITKATALARTQQTSAKKKKAKKATKKPAKKAKKPKKKAKKKKAKKKKKKKAKKKKKKKKKKVVKYPGGKRSKGQHKSKAMKASRFSFWFSARCQGIGNLVFHQKARGGQVYCMLKVFSVQNQALHDLGKAVFAILHSVPKSILKTCTSGQESPLLTT